MLLETCSLSDVKRNLSRPSGKRHSLSHSSEDMSFDMIDHVPRNNPESSFSVRLYILDDIEAVILMIIIVAVLI